MAISQQKLRSVSFKHLKSLRNIDIDFGDSELTAIMGTNGSGKSTILHALACCYKPLQNLNRINFKFSDFFKPTIDSAWKDSSFVMYHDYRDGIHKYENIPVEFSKGQDRWKPKYVRRPQRHVVFIGISTCVPKIEQDNTPGTINYSTQPLSDAVSNQIKEKAGYVMNRDYSSYNLHKTVKSNYIGVEFNSIRYSSLSMGAGEQRIFKILEEVYKAPKYSLMLIDEIDLLLHTDALKRLIYVLKDKAEQNNLQIVFTTHSQIVTDMTDIVNIRHIYQSPEKTLCFLETKPDTIYRLTGICERPLEIFVEDDLAKSIVQKICERLSLLKYVSIKQFGAAINCFTLASGIALSGSTLENSLFVIDGDVYKTDIEKQEQVNSILTGNDSTAQRLRGIVLKQIVQFNLEEGFKPEKYLYKIIKNLPDEIIGTYGEIKQAAFDIGQVNDSHKYIDDIIKRIGYERTTGLDKIAELVSRSSNWDNYVKPVYEWLHSKGHTFREC